MAGDPFVSFGQNHEDVVLWRALGSIAHGRYVEVGANDPVNDSVSKAFYDRGWSGMSVEPDPTFAARLRSARQRDIVVEAAVTTRGDTVTLHLIEDTGLSTLDDDIADRHGQDGYSSRSVVVRGARLDTLLSEHGFDTGDVHFLMVDVEGLEADVLSSVDLRSWRPWVLVIEATAPRSNHSTHDNWEPAVLDAGYQFCLFDGISRFYVADERAEELKEALSYPACVLDGFVDHTIAVLDSRVADRDRTIAALHDQMNALRHEVTERIAETVRWRRAALVTWANRVVRAPAPPTVDTGHLEMLLADARADAAALRQTVSWRVTGPLRIVRRRTLSRPR